MIPTRLTMKVVPSAVYGAAGAGARDADPAGHRRRARRTHPAGADPPDRYVEWGDPVDVVTDDKGHATASLLPQTDVDVRVSFTGPVGWTPRMRGARC